MSTLNQILIAISIGLFAALVLTIYLALAGHNKCYQRALSYRILESRCRAIVSAVNGAWPEMEEYTGDEYVEEIDAKLKQMRETEKLLRAEYIGNDEFLQHFDPVEVVRYLMARNTELARAAEAVTYWEKAQPAPLRTVTIANRVIEALAVNDRWNGLQSAGAKAENDRMQREYRSTLSVCAKYAPGMTFADSLPIYVEACLEFTRQKAHEAGMAAAFASTKA